jgi:hypothetical protein
VSDLPSPQTNREVAGCRVPQVSRLRPGILRVKVHHFPCYDPRFKSKRMGAPGLALETWDPLGKSPSCPCPNFRSKQPLTIVSQTGTRRSSPAPSSTPERSSHLQERAYGPWGKVVECFVTRIVATVPLALAFAQPKSARVSTAGAIRARYQGSSRRVLFKATSIDLSQDARSIASEGESNRHSFHAPEYQRGTTGDRTAKPPAIAPTAVRLSPYTTLPTTPLTPRAPRRVR